MTRYYKESRRIALIGNHLLRDQMPSLRDCFNPNLISATLAQDVLMPNDF